MLDEIKTSVGSVLRERLVSPLFGAFFISWCLWNVPLLYYMFTVDGKVPVETRLALLRTVYFNRYDGILLPLASTIIIVFIYPIISGAVLLFIIKVEAYFKERSSAIQKKIPLPMEDAVLIYESFDKEKERNARLFKDKNERIHHLSKQLEELNAKLDDDIKELKQQHESEYSRFVSSQEGYTNEIEKLKRDFQGLLSQNKFEKNIRITLVKTLEHININRLGKDKFEEYDLLSSNLLKDESLKNSFIAFITSEGNVPKLNNKIEVNMPEVFLNMGLVEFNDMKSYYLTSKGHLVKELFIQKY